MFYSVWENHEKLNAFPILFKLFLPNAPDLDENVYMELNLK